MGKGTTLVGRNPGKPREKNLVFSFDLWEEPQKELGEIAMEILYRAWKPTGSVCIGQKPQGRPEKNNIGTAGCIPGNSIVERNPTSV